MIAAGIDYDKAGAGPPAIALHGIGGDATSFAPQMGALPVRLIAWCMPGYRGSASAPLTFESLAERLFAFMDALGVEAAHLIGHSIGGMVAMEAALRRPERVASLALIGTTPSFGGRDESFKEAFLKARLACLDAGATMAEMAAKAAPQIVGPGASADVIAAVERPLARTPAPVWRAILECLTTFNRRDDLVAMTMPACLIAGSEDRNAPARTMEKTAAKMPNAAYHLIEGAGHMINQEAPEAVNRILAEFYAAQAAPNLKLEETR
ncbi:MAG: alpha/beta hydrolase [Pseudomonadota bacterium]